MPVGKHEHRSAFTLIELLVVIAIIALLVGILLPALGSARNTARTVKCGVNLRQVAVGVASYHSTYKGIFPPHYVYANSVDGMDWRMEDQVVTNPNPGNGYIHWSASLFGEGQGAIPEEAFTCPAAPNGGAPRANPGNSSADWEANQINDLGGTVGSAAPKDRQAKRMAYAGNGAIFPRNKFYESSGQRRNQLVKDAWIEMPSSSILMTEYLARPNWSSLSVGGVIKSHRPITPFVGVSSGGNVYDEPVRGGAAAANFFSFRYPLESEILKDDGQIPDGVIEDANAPMNCVGRTHPGKDSKGGSSNFAFVDGHVEQTTVSKTIKERKWGSRFYSITGDNKIDTRPLP